MARSLPTFAGVVVSLLASSGLANGDASTSGHYDLDYAGADSPAEAGFRSCGGEGNAVLKTYRALDVRFDAASQRVVVNGKEWRVKVFGRRAIATLTVSRDARGQAGLALFFTHDGDSADATLSYVHVYADKSSCIDGSLFSGRFSET